MKLILIGNTKVTTITLSVLFIFLLKKASAGMKTVRKKETFECTFHEKQSKFIGTKAAIPKNYFPLNLINILHTL